MTSAQFLAIISRVLAREMLRKEHEKMSAQYFVFVRCGVVEEVRNAQGDLENTAVQVIDFDMAENGDCPVCLYHSLSEPYDPEKPCPQCGYDLSEGSEQDAIKAALAYESK